MRTEHRLNAVYKNARIEYFDDDSKYVFFSDCHRGVGNLSDDFTRNQIIYLYALKYYFNNGFVYIEAGDGDELWENSTFEKNKRSHFEVYETIKNFYDRDRFILLYGNHNIYLRNHKYVDKHYSTLYDESKDLTFDFLKGIKPEEALVLRHSKTGQEIFTIHGHQGDFANDQIWFLSMLSSKYFWRYMHAFGGQNPTSPVKNLNVRRKIEKNCKKWIAKNKTMIICGHTHRFNYPRGSDLPYFNIGCCVYPTTITAIEIEYGKIQLVRWRVFSDDEGVLKVMKKVLGGPEPIDRFDIR